MNSHVIQIQNTFIAKFPHESLSQEVFRYLKSYKKLKPLAVLQKTISDCLDINLAQMTQFINGSSKSLSDDKLKILMQLLFNIDYTIVTTFDEQYSTYLASYDKQQQTLLAQRSTGGNKMLASRAPERFVCQEGPERWLQWNTFQLPNLDRMAINIQIVNWLEAHKPVICR